MNKEDESKLKKHKFIVFCQDHYNPLGLIRSLGEAGINPVVILVTGEFCPWLIVKSKYPSQIHKVESKEEGLDLLVSLYGNEPDCKPFIYSCSDDICELLDKNYNKLVKFFYFFHGNKQGAVSEYLNKDNINKIALKHGCKVLNNEVLNKGELPVKLKYPVITKAMDSILPAWKDEMHICNNKEELFDAYKEIRSDKVLVQEFIKKKNELCLDGFSFNDGEDVYIPYYTNYLRFSELSYGAYMVLRPFEKGVIYNQIKSILKEIGFTGIFSVEFLVDDSGNSWFLEINFRNSTWSYAYTYGGYNMPFLWAAGTLFGKNFVGGNSGISLKKEFTAMAEYEDYDMMVRSKKISQKQWIKDYINTDVHFFANKNDPGPFSITKFIIKENIKNIIRCIAHLFGRKFKE